VKGNSRERLLEAIRRGDAGAVREILLGDSRVLFGEKWRPEGRQSDGGAAFLAEALSAPRERILKLKALLAGGADVNTSQLPGGTTLLNLSLSTGDRELFEFLISEGADVNRRDRRGIVPAAIALLQGDERALSILRSAGAECAPAGLLEAEQAFVLPSGRALYAEIHEIVKWASRSAGVEITEVRIPSPWREPVSVLYRLVREEKAWRVRLVFPGGDSLSLTLENAETGEFVADLLPGAGDLTGQVLRGHLATVFKGLSSPGFAEWAKPAPVVGSSDATTLLGISSSATAEEITRAYRKLARVYHPDRLAQGAPAGERAESERRMREINRAYEELGRGRKPRRR
jgi:hypothetical protein